MKKTHKSLLSLAILGISVGAAYYGLEAQAAAKNSAKATLNDKRCEKCERGEDGKMVCKEVACPK